jgi:O-antigen ligase
VITENDQTVLDTQPASTSSYPGFWLLVPVALLIFFPPFFRGLFFSPEILVTHVLTSAVFLLFCFRRLRNRDGGLINGAMDWAVLALVGAYLLSLPGAVNMREALGGFYKVLNYFMIYWLVREAAVNYRINRTLLIVLFTSSLGVALIGIGAALGYFKYPGAFDGRHIMSTLQYINATSIYMGIMSLIGISLAVTGKRFWLKAFFSLASFLMMMVMFNASSKGAWAALFAVAIIYMVYVPNRKRLESVCLLLTTLAASAITAAKLLPVLISKEPLPPAANTIISELGGLTDFGSSSFLARLDFYSDAVGIMRNSSLFGTGAGGWDSLYHQYQDHLYWTTEVHNHFLQAGVEAGLPGLLAWIGIAGVLLFCLYRLWQRRNLIGQSQYMLVLSTACAALGLVLHSFIDFDLSIPSLQILLFAFFGLISGAYNAEFSGRPVGGNTTSFRVRPSLSRIITGLVVLLSLLLMITGGCFAMAAFHADKAEKAAQAGQYPRALSHYDTAARLDPLNGKYYTDFARFCAVMWSRVEPDRTDSPLYKQAVMEARLAEDLAWNDYKTMLSVDETYRILGSEEDMVRVGKRVIELNPWVVDGYNRLLGTYVEGIGKWLSEGDLFQAKDNAGAALALAEQLEQQIRKVNDDRGWSGPTLEFNDSIKTKLAQVYFYQGDYKQAIALVESCSDEELVKNQQFQAFYAALLYKSGKEEAASVIVEQDRDDQDGFEEVYRYLISLAPLMDN